MQNLTPWSIYLEFINWQKFEPTLEKYAFGQTFTVVNGLILKNDLAIWSHWLRSLQPETKQCSRGMNNNNDLQQQQLTTIRSYFSSGHFWNKTSDIFKCSA